MTLAGLATEMLSVEAVCLSLGFSVVLGLVLFFGGFYGGADIKALIFIGLTLPSVPLGFSPVLGVLWAPLVLGVFCSSALLSMVWPLAIFILNLQDHFLGKPMFDGIKLTIPQRVLLLFTARKIPLEKIENLRYFPAENVVLQKGKPTRARLHFVKAETDLSKYIQNLKTNKELYQKGVLATPTIPTICVLTLTLVIMLLAILL
jgi:hypothetical protein